MPLSAWLRLPAARLRARLGRAPERPWIVPAAVGWLGRRMRRDWRGARAGLGPLHRLAGEAPASVLAFEDNEQWLERAPGAARRDHGIANVELARPAGRPLRRRARCAAGRDLRPRRGRLPRVARGRPRRGRPGGAARKVRPGGYLLLDDSDRPAYAEAYELLADWRRAALHRRQGRLAAGLRDDDLPAARGNRRGPLAGASSVSEPVSRILSWAAIYLCGLPGPRRAGSTVLLGLAPGGVCLARLRHRGAGALLPHHFTLACARLTCGRAIGGLLSAALSRGFPRVGVTHRPALWCPDFPRSVTSW